VRRDRLAGVTGNSHPQYARRQLPDPQITSATAAKCYRRIFLVEQPMHDSVRRHGLIASSEVLGLPVCLPTAVGFEMKLGFHRRIRTISI
jgi:hypothetical protein